MKDVDRPDEAAGADVALRTVAETLDARGRGLPGEPLIELPPGADDDLLGLEDGLDLPFHESNSGRQLVNLDDGSFVAFPDDVGVDDPTVTLPEFIARKPDHDAVPLVTCDQGAVAH